MTRALRLRSLAAAAPVPGAWALPVRFPVALAMLAATALLALPARAAVPDGVAVQGILRDNQGALQTMPLLVTVSFFDARVAGNRVAGPFGPLQAQADNGLFSVIVGDANLGAALAGAPDVWLEVIEGNDVFPREHVTSQPYALVARLVAGPFAGDVSGTQGAMSVQKIRGVSVAAAAPADGNALTYDAAGQAWTPRPSVAVGTGYVAGGMNQTVFNGSLGTLAHASYTAPADGIALVQATFQLAVDNVGVNGAFNCNVQWVLDTVANHMVNGPGYGANLYPKSIATRDPQSTGFLAQQASAIAQFPVAAGQANNFFLNGATSCTAATWANVR